MKNIIKKILKKLSIKTQIIISISILVTTVFILYLIYLNLIQNTDFYLKSSSFSNIIYWLIGAVVIICLSILIIEKITAPIDDFVEYLRNLQEINFDKEIEDVLSKDGTLITKEFANLKATISDEVQKLKLTNQEVLRLMEEKDRDFEYKKTLVTSLSHDIKTPLTVIYTTISGINDGIITGSDVKKELDNVIREIERTTSLLQDLISIYRIDSEIKKAKIEETSLLNMVNKVSANMSKLYIKHEHLVKINFPKDVTVKVDSSQFERVLNNLIINAIIHSPNGSEIDINLVSTKENDILEIINTNVQIDPLELPHLFEPFYKTDKARNRADSEGNGLGLFIVKEICKKNGLVVDVCNIDNGVKFYIVFAK